MEGLSTKITYRTSVFATVFLGSLVTGCSLAVIYAILDVIQNPNKWPLYSYIGVLMFAWLAVYLFLWLKSNRITVSHELVEVSYTVPKNSLLPITVKKSFYIKDVQNVLLGSAGYLEKMAKTNNEIKEEVQHLKKLKYEGVSLWIATRHTPILFVQEKNGIGHTINTKPFSKKAFIHLLSLLADNGVSMEIEKGII